MPTLRLTFFGSPQIELNGTPVQVPTPKALALLVDVHEFQQFLRQVHDHPHAPSIACAGCVPLLLRATDLYRDDFLRGFTLPDSPAFDEWQAFQTDLFQEKLIESLTCVPISIKQLS